MPPEMSAGALDDDMRAALRGNGEVYGRLLAALADHVRRTVARDLTRFGLTAEAEDVVQETLLAIHLKRHTWDETRPLLPWVNAIAHYKVLDAGRRRGRRAEVPFEGMEDVLPAPETDMTRLVPLQRCLDALPQRQRQVVEALAVEGASVKETAARLKTSETAIRVALHRGLATLAAKFGAAVS